MNARPRLVCRWRYVGGEVPLLGRHIRALGARAHVTPELAAWAKQHLEWKLASGTREMPNGVLMLVVDEAGTATFATGPYEPLRDTSPSALVARAEDSAREERTNGVAPEVLASVNNGVITFYAPEKTTPAGVFGLAKDVCDTLGIAYAVRQMPPAGELETNGAQLALFSDEHGVVMPAQANAPELKRLAEAINKLYVE